MPQTLTLSEITRNIEAAVADLPKLKKTMDDAKAKAKASEVAYLEAGASIKTLYEEYKKVMQDVLSLGGTIHQ